LPNAVNFLELIGGGRVPVVLVGTWLVMAILLIFALVARAAIMRAPDPLVPDEGTNLRAVAESAVEWFSGLAQEVTGIHESKKLVPFFGSLFFFILFANLLGLIPGMEPPTSNSDLTFALGIISFIYFIVFGVRANGALGYLRTFLGPLALLAPLMLPLELVSHLFRPFTLGMRLGANMLADHMVLGMFTSLTKIGIPLAFYALGSIVCVVQALVFVILSMSYVRLAVSHDH
jgi:F-type H+-transporting ATPase subunit a